MTDVIVVGGGPAGSSLALQLGRRGLGVELFDQSSFPREKPCGEGLMPGGVEALEALELGDAIAGQPIHGVCYHVGAGSVRAGFAPPDAGQGRRPRLGLGQRRLHFDHAIWQAASATPGVSAYEGVCVEGPLVEHGRVTGVLVGGATRRARLVVAADGTSSLLRRKLGLDQSAPLRRVGVRAHYLRSSGQPPLRDVQIFLRPGYELYVTPLPGNEILVAALAHHDAVSGNIRAAFETWRQREPLLCHWLDGATQLSELSGRAPLTRRGGAGPHPRGLVFLGDAATSVDPITAAGMSLALMSAELLAAHLPEMLDGSRLAEQRFERSRAKAVRIHRILAACLLELGRRPAAQAKACAVMRACPSFMNSLVQLASVRVAP